MVKRLIVFILVLFSISFISAFDFGETSVSTNNIYVINNDSQLYHNNMTGLQGGGANSYFHLTEAIYNVVVAKYNDWIENTVDDLVIKEVILTRQIF